MTPRPASILIALAAILLLAASPAPAEIAVGDSIEWLVADSDVIAKCRLVSITDDEPTAVEPWKRAEFKVTEAFKGEAGERIFVRMYPPLADSVAATVPFGVDTILFFRRTDQPGNSYERGLAKYPLRLADSWRFHLGRRGQPATRPVAFTSDLRVLRTPEEIEQALRKAIAANVQPVLDPPPPLREPSWYSGIRQSPGRPWWIMLDTSGTGVDPELWSGSATLLRVPIDSRIEALAYEWAGKPHTLVRAVDVLRFFKTDRSIAIFQSLLADPTIQPYGYGGPATKWRFPIRETAYRTLVDWGVDVPRPPLDMPADAYWQVPPLYLAAGLAVVLLTLMLATRVVRRCMRCERRGYATCLADAACLTLVLVAAWVAVVAGQERTIPEATAGIGPSQYWLWLNEGKVTAARAVDWQFPRPLSVAVFPVRGSPPQRWDLPGNSKTIVARKLGFVHTTGQLTPQISTPTYGGPGKASVYTTVVAPLWAVLTVLLLWPFGRVLAGVYRAWRRWWRRFNGLCPACGYDLRGGHDRCPECGVAVVPAPILAEDAPRTRGG